VARPLRYTFILVLAALATSLAAVGGWHYARASAPVNGPIILISVDTLRADRLPAYGYREIKTPALDALAADGVVFERAYSHAPQTLPAHAALLSGRLPFETGVRDEGMPIKAGEKLLQQLLHDRGFTTGAVVSSSRLARATGIARGFDFFDADFAPAAEDRRDGGDSEAIAEHWLDSAGTSRAFLFLHLDDPHAPYAAHAEAIAPSPTYESEIVYADEIVGRLIKYLKAHQLYDRSTIVLASDHGEGLGDHGEREHGLFLYDEAIHVPLVIKQPAGVGAGTRVRDRVQHIDLVPTVLELVKAPVPSGLRGRSLRPLLDGSGRIQPQTIYAEAQYGSRHFGWSPLTAAIGDRYVYIRAPREELYDLLTDPHQHENIAADHLAERTALASAMGKLVPRAAVTDLDPTSSPIDPKDKYEIVETYRAAVDLAASRKWAQAVRLLQSIVKQDGDLAEAWGRIGEYTARLDRLDQAADAYARAWTLRPNADDALSGAAVLLKLHRLDDARERAQAAADGARDGEQRGAAHELLARIALARHDADEARAEADQAQKAQPARPVAPFVAGRLLFDDGLYDDALPQFERAIAAERRGQAAPIAELHFYMAEALMRLNRLDDAETEYEAELRAFPRNTRASAALATLYQGSGRPDDAQRVISQMLDATPTPEVYAMAARLWTALGDSRQAAATRAEARKAFPEAR